jgi:hypothetical protein
VHLTRTVLAGTVLAGSVAVAAPAPAQDRPAAAAGAELKVRKVVLYKHGVGYFERDGKVAGDVTIPLGFKTSQMADVLKSLFAVHTAGRGRIESIVYDSKDPLAKQLGDIMVNVPDGNALTAFLRQLKGAPVEITVGNATVRGRVMGIEPLRERTEHGTTTRYKVVLLGEDGVIRPLELLDASGIRVLERGLQRDLRRMMEIFAKARHADRKTVSLRSVGQGPRTLRVGYIIEQPIWKTTYRLIFDEGEQPLLQGWAIVENRTDEDWEQVDLTCVAGSPLSFLMDLYTSYYPERPVVGVQAAEGANLRPAELAEKAKVLEEAMDKNFKRRGGARFRKEAREQQQGQGGLGRLLAASLAPAAAGASAGELFAYNAKGKVDVERGQAALVPILLESIEGGERILYFRRDLSRHPQHAFYLKNSSALTLEKGPITVFEGSTCQGESLLNSVLKPGMRSVLPYAIETAVEIDADATVRPVTRARLVRGVLWLYRSTESETVYNVREKGGTDRTVYLDHARRGGWDLLEPKEPAETLPAHARFKVAVKAGAKASLKVRERREVSQTVRIANSSLDQLAGYLQQPYLTDGARTVLGKAQAILTRVAAAQRSLSENAAERKQLQADHERVRRTLGAFRTTADERAMREKYLARMVKIDEQIDALDQARTGLQDAVNRGRAELAALLQGFTE